MLPVFLAFVVWCTASDIFVSPSGSDKNQGTASAPLRTLEHARDVASALSTDVNINLEAGTYVLSSTLVLNPKHSGLSWRPAPGASGDVIISGGVTITGAWEKVLESATLVAPQCASDGGAQRDCGWPYSTKEQCAAAGCCWHDQGIKPSGRYCVQPSGPTIVYKKDVSSVQHLQSRHLFVDGKRALRTILLDSELAVIRKSTADENGYKVETSAPLQWPNGGSGVEFSFAQEGSPWTEARCAVSNVTKMSDMHSFIYMTKPCHTMNLHRPCGQGAHTVAGVENVGPQYLRTPGEFYTDLVTKTLYYVPRAGEIMGQVEVIMPTLETLISLEGTYKSPVTSVSFEGLSFQHATWLRPSQAEGYVEQQTGVCSLSKDFKANVCDDTLWHKSPGNIELLFAQKIVFKDCGFEHLGGNNAIDLGLGCTDNRVDTCSFRDLSGASVQIGDFAHTFNITDPTLQVARNTVVNCSVHGGVEYKGTVGIQVGYAKDTLITHNDISRLYYGGVSVGWGWAREIGYNSGNNITYNNVHDYKRELNDGGGIYMLGPQPHSKIHHNWVHNQGTASSGALYPDEGSAYTEWFSNVVQRIGSSEWLHLWTKSIHDVSVHGNFADTAKQRNQGTNCPEKNNVIFPPDKPPSAAQAIITTAGNLP